MHASAARVPQVASQARLRDRNATDTELQRWRNVHTSAEAIHRMAMNLLDVMRSEDGQFADQGPGIPAEAREHVFAKGVQLDNNRAGRGLGLAFCKLAVESHGGTIAIESNIPAGSVFVVRVPLVT